MTTLTASRVRHSDRDVTLAPSFGVTTKSPRQESDACASQRRHTRDSETSRRETSRVRHCDSDVTPLAIKIALPFQRGRNGVDLAGCGQARPSAAPHTPGALFFGARVLPALFGDLAIFPGVPKGAPGAAPLPSLLCRNPWRAVGRQGPSSALAVLAALPAARRWTPPWQARQPDFLPQSATARSALSPRFCATPKRVVPRRSLACHPETKQAGACPAQSRTR